MFELGTLKTSHLTALGNDNVQVRNILAAVTSLSGLHLPHDIEAIDDLAEDDVLPVEEGSGNRGDEELGSVGIGPGILDGFGQSQLAFAFSSHTKEKKKKKKEPTAAGKGNDGDRNIQPWKGDQAGRVSA